MGIGLIWDGFIGVGFSWYGIVDVFFLLWDQSRSYIFSFFFVFQVCQPVFLHFGHRDPVTPGFTFFHIGLFNCFLICSCQCCGGPRAVKAAMVTRFPFLQAGHLRCNRGVAFGSHGLPSFSCNPGITVPL